MGREHDGIVSGEKRAGCEAALINIRLDAIALMPCNPAFGGLAKSQLLQDVMQDSQRGRIADRTALHVRLGNASKGRPFNPPAFPARDRHREEIFSTGIAMEGTSRVC